ncbi:glyoxylate/hydroxypyruvate reductase A [Thalassospira sp.]|uniref:2-hydroxyacid dehydrogenase n=1 Tax=Thalassospira sp. TaxID=1912094 RepID=UPI000E854A5E|nr:glyoxylate/hydroxypyruvate reductase A [Thalassospira sp.]|eukprot:NODE_631_length_1750_cov_1.263093_g621_i0.p1 GENE.NODE_631_length_1750_cov_1.263093_g621_i0~~NODE_631_length_1750_cov_1.263093_g621_i0.p1  ORF type:complete len:316 (+),score=37.45 NODE_631_length_1750_cov_1.263093_g621_i0:204-1151(+)
MSAANNAPNILISAAGEDAAWKEAMVARLPGAKIVTGDENYDPETIDYALFWKQPQGLIKTLSNLKAIFSLGAGVDHVVSSPSLPADLPVIRLEDAGMADQMVQYHLYAALHFMRDFDIYSDQQAKADWTQHPVARISKCRIGVMGLGALGAAVATALSSLGFGVSGWSRSMKAIDGITTFAGKETLGEFLGQSDILICLLPRTSETENVLNSTTLSFLPKGAAIINAARGAMINEADLLRALDTGHLRGAFLDVAVTEPLPESHPFWDHPKIRITPHIAAETRIEESVEQIAENIDRINRGETPRGLVNRETGY